MTQNSRVLMLVCEFCLVNCGKSATPAPNALPAANQAVPLTNSHGNTIAGRSRATSDAQGTPDTESTAGNASNSEATAFAGSTIAEQDDAKPLPDSRPLTDSEIAGVTEAANTSEIEAAKVAERKAKNAEVKRFAGMVLTHHQ
jgi:predicted outer membrane protein